MNSNNPYQTPNDDSNAFADSPNVLVWSVGTVFGCSLLGGVLGLFIGAALGTIVPGYYRSVFSNGDSANFDPVAVGIGQGLTQGIVFGGVIGLVLVAMYYWSRHLRSSNQARDVGNNKGES